MGDTISNLVTIISDFLTGLPDLFLAVFKVLGVVALVLLALAVVFGLLLAIHNLLALPMRRAERARLFLDVLESILKQGQPLEEALISLADSRDLSMGPEFHLLCAWLETGLPFIAALDKAPDFLPPQVNAMLRSGQQMGDVARVLPACRQLLNDASSQTWGAFNYVLILTLVITPTGFSVCGFLMVFVIPKFREVFAGMGVKGGMGLMNFYSANLSAIMFMQAVVLLVIWAFVLAYIGGPRVARWFPVLERWHYLLPWRRRRMQRDFSTMLAILLDAGMTEASALTLAADCSANQIFRARAARAVKALQEGVTLAEAIHRVDDSGEFRWRLGNATRSPGGFRQALAGWHEALDARAFQQEQAASHVITTGLVLWSGLFVGGLLIGVFLPLTSMIQHLALW